MQCYPVLKPGAHESSCVAEFLTNADVSFVL
jgi:hypothetical protein